MADNQDSGVNSRKKLAEDTRSMLRKQNIFHLVSKVDLFPNLGYRKGTDEEKVLRRNNIGSSYHVYIQKCYHLLSDFC